MSSSESSQGSASAHPETQALCQHDREVPEVDLLTPLTLRGLTLKNRIVMSPMCQYIAKEGMASDWHLVHLGSRAVGGTGLIFVEATAVSRNGRITPGCLGLWNDDQIAPLKRIVDFAHQQGSHIGIQLAHAGRKASCDVPWQGGKQLTSEPEAWTCIAPSPLPFNPGETVPEALSEEGIQHSIAEFRAAVQRAIQAGFDTLEIHSAHGYLLHEFLSPLSNQRTDHYGGSLENRMRFLVEVVTAARDSMPASMPLFVRISGTDWVDGGWDITQSVVLAHKLKELGVDAMDVSSGGNVPQAQIPVGKEYQVPLARQIRHETGLITGAVGLITEPAEANDIVSRGDADLIFLGRQLLREPYWAERAMTEMGADPDWPLSYGYAVRRRSSR